MANKTVVGDVADKNDGDLLKNIKKKIDGQTAHPLYSLGIIHSAVVVQGLWDDMNNEIIARDNLDVLSAGKTANISTMHKNLVDIINNDWATTIQRQCGDDAQKVKDLSFRFKGDVEHAAPTTANIPLCTGIDINVSGEHTIHIIDTVNNLAALPYGILRCDVYGQTGGELPTSLAELIAHGGGWLGSCDRGKFVYSTPADAKGKTEYYIFVYILSATKKPFAYSKVYSALIN